MARSRQRRGSPLRLARATVMRNARSIINLDKEITMKKSYLRTVLLSMFSVQLFVSTAVPQQLKLAFEEVAQSADLIFAGTVSNQSARMSESKTMIFTHVAFSDIAVISANQRSIQKDSQLIRLIYAGGHLADASIRLSDMPTFIDGHRYLIFMYDDGKIYANPVIGGYQGQFEIIRDTILNQSFVLTAGRKPILEANTSGIILSDRRVSSVQGGNLVFEEQPDGIREKPSAEQPTPADSFSKYDSRPTARVGLAVRLKLSEFIDYIRNVALRSPLKKKMLKRGEHEQGSLFKNNGGKMEVEELKLSNPPVRILSKERDTDDELYTLPKVPTGETSTSSVSLGNHSNETILGGTLGACGYHSVFLTMEQVATSSWTYSINDNCMGTWNLFMDVYRYTADDGSFGNNSQNEFCGFVSDANLYSAYGFHWGSALAITITVMELPQQECGRISQSDLAWNSAYSWTSDAESAIGNSNVILLRSVNMHELGHTWGEQQGSPYPETYDYDQPTVMHAYYSYLVEDGWGIHRADAYLIRRQYQDQTSIKTTKDVGVESYYASNGLINSTTNASSYYPGQTITLSNVTVENISYSAVSDLRIRFYLSTNRTITTSDYQMGPYWSWTSFSGESDNVGNYTTTIPTNIPAGTYYVGAIVTINGFGNDDYTYNNSTSFYDSVTIKASPTITASAGGGGTISPSGVVSVIYGANQSFTITPNTGYHVADVLVDGSSAGAVTSYTFNSVTANHTISASFAINTYTITASAGSNGTISPSGSVSVNYGADTTFTITPNTNYQVDSLLIDATKVDTTRSYTFHNVTANHSISVWFGTVTSVKELTASIPRTYSLSQNYPNPFNPSTRLRFALPQRSTVSLLIYDILGREVNRPFYGYTLDAGTFEVQWDGKDETGASLPSGLYFLRIIATDDDAIIPSYTSTKKLLLLK